MSFDPIKAGQEEAVKNAKIDKRASRAKTESLNTNIKEMQDLAQKNSKSEKLITPTPPKGGKK